VVTLAAPGAERVIENIERSGKERFMLHYNFPGYSVGEAKSFRGPGRRDIGHGALAEKAVRRVLPSVEEFPYTIRVVSEILSSNGSSSMATVCASILSLMDAGVPIKKSVAGIAMGLMSAPDGRYKVLTDIQGPEDHYGDMDFKVAGTKDGINAIQMDVKIAGVPLNILLEGFKQAKKARLEILSVMDKALSAPRPEISKHAPQVTVINIDPSRIGEVIGPGGKIINGIIARTGVAIDIDESGKVFVSAKDKSALEAGVNEVRAIVREFKIGEVVEGEVVRVLDFGAIVDLGGGNDGMIHVSELKEGFVKNVTDVINLGDFVRAKIIKVEEGKIGLSLKQLKEE
jgi:polyribonucleotide nucleotidyltransferase